MAHTIELSDDVYERLRVYARDLGLKPQELVREWLAEHAAATTPPARAEEQPAAKPTDSQDWKKQWMAEFGNLCDDPNASDNERIDADLVEEYGSDHEDEAKR